MKLTIIRSDLGGALLLNNKRIKMENVGSLIREGNDVEILDPLGYDYTQETLVKVAFQDVFPPNIKDEYLNIMSEFFDRSDLLLIIENGGYDSFIQRRSRCAILEGNYYFDKIENLIKIYMRLGKDKQEMLNYLDNLIGGLQ